MTGLVLNMTGFFYTITKVHKYTSIQFNKYIITQVNKYTSTQVNKFTSTKEHKVTSTQVQNKTRTQEHKYAGTPFYVGQLLKLKCDDNTVVWYMWTL